MSSSHDPASHDSGDDFDDEISHPVTPAKGAVRKEDEFGDFNEEDFDDDFDDDFEEEMEDEYELAEIEGEVEVAEVDDEDLVDLPMVAKIVKADNDSDDGFDDALPAAEEEEEEEFEDEAE